MQISSHWSFNLRELGCLFAVTLAMWGLFFLLLPEELGEAVELPTLSWREIAISTIALVLIWLLILTAGVVLSRRVGIQPLALSSTAADGRRLNQALVILRNGLLWGLAVAIVFELLHRFLFQGHVDQWNAEVRFGKWRTYIAAAIGAALGEEAIFRMLLFPLLAWLFVSTIATASPHSKLIPRAAMSWTSDRLRI